MLDANQDQCNSVAISTGLEKMNDFTAAHGGLSVIDSPVIDEPQNTFGGQNTLRASLNVLFKYKWVVLLFFVIVSTSFAVVSVLLYKPLYKASAQVLLSPGRETLPSVGGADPARFGFNGEEQVAQMIEMLTGRLLAERVVRAIGPSNLYPNLGRERWAVLGFNQPQNDDPRALLEMALEKFKGSVSAELAGKSSLVNVGFKHEDPAIAAKVVNLLVETYLDQYLAMQRNPRIDALFQEQFELQKQRLQASEAKLAEFKQRYAISSSVKEEQELSLKEKLATRTTLDEARSREAEVGSRLLQLRAQLAGTSRQSGTIDRIRDRLTALELQENELLQRVTSEHPNLRAVRAEMRPLRDKLAQIEAETPYGTVSSGQNSAYAQLQEEILRNEAELKALSARQQAAAAKLAEYKHGADTLDSVQVEFDHLQQQVQLDQQNYRLYVTKAEESRIAALMNAERIASFRIVQRAELPFRPVDSKLSLKILQSLLAGGVGAIALAFVLRYTSRRLDTIEDVERCLDLPVVASIPYLRLRGGTTSRAKSLKAPSGRLEADERVAGQGVTNGS
jgi:uncharacterized protein involved in exopolysaccharide biosynthesis